MAEDSRKFSEQMLGATFDFAKLAVTSLILLSGAAATALLAFIGTHTAVGKQAWIAVTAFAVGAWLGGMSSVLAYTGQRLDWEIASGRRTDSRFIAPVFWTAYVFVGVGYLLFVVGCIAASSALATIAMPMHTADALDRYLDCEFSAPPDGSHQSLERDFLVVGNFSKISDSDGVTWKLTKSNSLIVIAERPENGGYFDELQLERVSGTAQFTRNAPVRPTVRGRTDSGTSMSVTHSLQMGKCSILASRTIGLR